MDTDAVEVEAEREFDYARVVAFTDGVFAIATTLLVLGLGLKANVPDLSKALENQLDSLFAYALSFIVLARLWLSHHEFVGGLERFDRRLISLNMYYLAWIALIPFTSQVLGDYASQHQAVMIYAASLVGVSTAFGAQIVYAYRRGLFRPAERGVIRRELAPGTFSVAIIFALSIPVGYVAPRGAIAMWILAAFLPDFTGRWLAGRIMD
jgi:uncharacterized membrane protein